MLWEAWQPEDVPNDLSKAGKAAVKSLLDPSPFYAESDKPGFPDALGKGLVVDYLSEGLKYHLILAHGQPNAVGAEIARFSFKATNKWDRALSGDTLYVFLDGQVHALVGRAGGPADTNWAPAWALDPLAGLPKQEREATRHVPVRLHATAEGVWVVHGPRILLFTPQGRKQAEFVLKNAWPSWVGDMGTALTFGKRLIYYRHGRGVIALDRDTKAEAWLLATTRFPYPSRVVEVGERLVFVQIGSDVPSTLQVALGAARYPLLPKLGPNTARQRVAAARLLHSYGDGYLRKQLGEYAGQLRKAEQGPEAKAAATAVENLLATWPRKRDRQRLLDACVTALLEGEGKGPPRAFGSPATERVLTWCLLQGLIYGYPPDGYDRPGVNYAYHSWDENSLFLDGGVAAKLADHCRQVIATGPEAEKPFAASVLVSRGVGWPRLTDTERKELFLSRQPSVWRWAAMSLVKNGWRKELVRWAPERPAADHLDIVCVLAHKMPKEWSKAELDFWLSCTRRTPGSVACLLNGEDREVPLVFRAPIRAYLENEIATPAVKDVGAQEAGELFAAVFVLDRWKKAEDTPLLLKYLHHPCIRLHGYVKDLLEKRGVRPPPGIVYE